MSFVKRKIELTFQLGKGNFGEDGVDTVVLTDLRVECDIVNFVGPALGQAFLRVYGLTPSLLNQLSALNQADQAERMNRLLIKAGDERVGMSIIFEGQVSLAQIDMQSAPNIALEVMATAGAFAALKTAEPISFPGSADAAIILANLAHKMGMSFENNGVSVMLATPYYSGTLLEQAQRCAEDANINLLIDHSGGTPGFNTLVIWPKQGARRGAVPLIAPETGLIGYPGYSSGIYSGIRVRCVFSPLIRIAIPVQVRSDLKVANGTWLAFEISHHIHSEVPGGPWQTEFVGVAHDR